MLAQPAIPLPRSGRTASPAPVTYHTLQVWLFGQGVRTPAPRCTRPSLALGRHFGGGCGQLRCLRTSSCATVVAHSVACVVCAAQAHYHIGASCGLYPRWWRPSASRAGCFTSRGYRGRASTPLFRSVLTGASHPPSPPVPGGGSPTAAFQRLKFSTKKKEPKKKGGHPFGLPAPFFFEYIVFNIRVNSPIYSVL